MASLRGIIPTAVILLICVAAPQAIAASTSGAPSRMKEVLDNGTRATNLLESRVYSKGGHFLGQVRNLVLADDGSIKAVITEQAGIGTNPEFVFRLPWKNIIQPVQPDVLIADLSDVHSNQFGLFANDQTAEFLVTEVIGDYARLQPGLGYGYVKDVVLTPEGRMVAILIARDKAAGGGTVAFPYPGQTGRWNPGMSYYGLPFVTAEQANDATIEVKSKN